jgi:tetratricopeptide (TPR) repeat protein
MDLHQKLSPEDQLRLAHRFVLMVQSGATAEATRTLATELRPDYALAWYHRAYAYEGQNQPAKAVADWWSRTIELEPRNQRALTGRARVYERLGQFDKAIADYSETLRIDGLRADVWNRRGAAYFRLNQKDKALADFSKAVELAPTTFLYLNNRANAYDLLGRFQEAMADREKILEHNANDPIALNDLAWFLATSPEPALRQTARAVELARKAVALAPNEGTIANTLGAALYRAGSWKEAIATLEKSLLLRNGGDSFDYFFLAMAHHQLGNHAEARRWYDRAVQWMDQNAPKDDELLRFRAEAAELLGVTEDQRPAGHRPMPPPAVQPAPLPGTDDTPPVGQ